MIHHPFPHFLQIEPFCATEMASSTGVHMSRSVHDSLVRFRANAALVEKMRAVAREQHQTPSEFMREVLREKTMEAA